MTATSTENAQQCHKYFPQYTAFASERPQVRTWGRQTCFLPRTPSNLVAPLDTTLLHLPEKAHAKCIENRCHERQ